MQERRSLTFSIFGFVTLLKQYCVLLIKHAPGEFHLCYTKGLLTYRFKNLTAVQSAVGSTCLIPFIGPLSPPKHRNKSVLTVWCIHRVWRGCKGLHSSQDHVFMGSCLYNLCTLDWAAPLYCSKQGLNRLTSPYAG